MSPQPDVSPWISVGVAMIEAAMSARLKSMRDLEKPEEVRQYLIDGGFDQKDVDRLWRAARDAEAQRRRLWAI